MYGRSQIGRYSGRTLSSHPLMLRFALAVLLAAPAVSAQEGGTPFGLPFLPASTYEAGVSQALAAAPTDNPYVLRHNPAFLADAGERPAFRFATSVAPQVYGSDDLLIGSSAASIGIAAGEIGGGTFQIGLGGGYAEYRLEGVSILDMNGNEVGAFDTEEREIGGGLAFGWDGPINVRVGAAAFSRESIEVPSDPLSTSLDRDRLVSMDIGGAVSYPVLAGPSEPDERAPRLDITGAAVYENVVLSEDFFERSPILSFVPTPPAEAVTAGVGARYALVRQLGRRGEFRLVEAGLNAQQSFVSNEVDRGALQASVVLAEILALRAGRSALSEGQQPARNAVGAELRIGGIVRAIGAAQESASMLALADRLTSRVEVAVWDVGSDTNSETVYYGLTLGWRP